MQADLQATRLIGQGGAKRSDRKRQAFCKDTLCNSFAEVRFARKRLQSLRAPGHNPRVQYKKKPDALVAACFGASPAGSSFENHLDLFLCGEIFF